MKKIALMRTTVLLLFLSVASASNEAVIAQKESSTLPAGQSAFTEERVVLSTPTGDIHGTLIVPKAKRPHPLVLIVVGSGPDDRDGNAPAIGLKSGSYKMLAEALAVQGIASLRYDKRGVAESAKAMVKQSDLRFENYISDAVLWGKKLHADRRFSTLTVVGHSEGSLIGMMAAPKLGADAFVSVAGLGRRADQALLDQVKTQLPADLLKKTEEIVTQLSAGKTVEPVPSQLNSLFHPSVQPYLISYFHYNPAQEIVKLRIPVLIIQGTTDIDVTVQDANLLAQAKPSAKLVLIEGMNHVLKAATNNRSQQAKTYTDPSLPLVPQLITETSSFVNQVKRRRR